MLNVFLTGINSNTGTTFITAGLAATMQSLGYSTCVYKPIQTGAIEKNGFAQSPDMTYIKTIDPYVKTSSSYFLKQKTTPAIAAESENILIDKNVIKQDYEILSKDSDCIITEGLGGLMVPISPQNLMSDLVKTLDIPIVLVVKPDTDAVNHALLTINHASTCGIRTRGVIINDVPEKTRDLSIKTTPRLIEEYSDARVLGIIKHFANIKEGKNVNPSDLITHVLNGIDIESVFDVKIAKLDID